MNDQAQKIVQQYLDHVEHLFRQVIAAPNAIRPEPVYGESLLKNAYPAFAALNELIEQQIVGSY